MTKVIRKGVNVRYTGKDELAQGRIFKVHKRTHDFISIMYPTRYMDGSVHAVSVSMHVKDFEIAE